LADANLYRFSSKELHPNSGIYYYGFRFYEPTMQRWMNKDPLGIGGGVNLYAAFFNSPPRFVDRNGLDNIWNMPAGQNAVPDIVASMPVGGGEVQSGYTEGIDPLFLLAGMTPFDPNQLLSLPGQLSDLVTLASDSSAGEEKLEAGVGLAASVLTKGKKIPCKVTKKIPRNKLKYRPKDRGKAPIGSDGKPVELHHIEQDKGNKSPRAEMTVKDHRVGDNYSNNHPNTGQQPSAVDRAESHQQHQAYWNGEWDNGEFVGLPEQP
jgi:RHS repeat-associated protein